MSAEIQIERLHPPYNGVYMPLLSSVKEALVQEVMLFLLATG